MAAPRLSEMASWEDAGGSARSQNGRGGLTTSLPAGRSERGGGHRLTAIGPSRSPSAAPLSWQRAGSGSGGGGRAEAASGGMEPAGAPPQGCGPAQEAEEPPGSPALPAEEPESRQPAGAHPGEGEPSAAAGRERERCRRGAGPQGPPGRTARGRGRRAQGRRGGEEGGRAGRRPRVTVDSSKAKTSLEALKISLRQLRWKEVSARQPSPAHRTGPQGAPGALPGAFFPFPAWPRLRQGPGPA